MPMPLEVRVLHPRDMSGDNRGIHHLHVTALKSLFEHDDSWHVSSLDPCAPGFADATLSCDVLILNMIASPELESVIRLRKSAGRPTVFEIYDNFLAVGDWLPADSPLRSPLVRQRIARYASLCDALHVYSPVQAMLFGSLNRNTLVANYYTPAQDAIGQKPAGFVIGWGGSRTHRSDLAEVAPAITDFCAAHSDAVLAFMGDLEMFRELFGRIPSAQVRFHPFSSHPEYLEFVRQWHIGLAPLRNTPFNLARSDDRFIIYAANGTVGVLADMPMFRPHTTHARLFSTPGDLLRVLEELYTDRSQMASLAGHALSWVKEHRSLEVVRAQRYRYYGSLLPSGATPRCIHCVADESGLANRLDMAFKAAQSKDFDRSLSICRELLEVHPDYPQAQWLTACNLEASGRYAEALDYADDLEISPVYHDLLTELQVRVARRIRPSEVVRHAGRFDSPVRRLRASGANGDGHLMLFRRILEYDPYDYFALRGAIRLIQREQPDSPELAGLFARACLVSPESVPMDLRPPHLASFLPA